VAVRGPQPFRRHADAPGGAGDPALLRVHGRFRGPLGALFGALRQGRAGRDALLFAAAWLVGEWVRGWAFTGFPWLASGYSQSPPSPLAGFAPVFGVFGVGGLLAAVAALAVAAIGTRNWRPALLALLLGRRCRAAPGRLDRAGGRAGAVALLQPNIEQSLKWRPEMLQHWLEVNLSMLRTTRPSSSCCPKPPSRS
jgi:apolipoprotein N-acyltransferase